jgi:hypothetical protein
VDLYIHSPIYHDSVWSCGCIDPQALVGGEWSASRPGRFTTGERAPSTRWIGGWVDPRAGLDDVEKRRFLILPGLELQHLGRPARSHSLYRLHCPSFSAFWLRSKCSFSGGAEGNKGKPQNSQCSTEIRTEDLLNTCQERCRYVSPLDGTVAKSVKAPSELKILQSTYPT